ncbi:SusD-like starch-binding protein associating with outer membrane [Mucilaginibacter yixingensis]|uniref:SusD-like starch-binding protein associating with outer membrane n=1 Tax=Mucilaginibacter yixingensis TaxID=1295612 RepID=A0A2T5JFQ9_9SPHI|nr:SusD/RagB family nutrient-binding outer membrane lipoprotein [Mucilaginibacter yixingensis]PTR01196.1 SusD-like starch-binding protein associating with outer membrane [Mucilaginibacter yixingensis]
MKTNIFKWIPVAMLGLVAVLPSCTKNFDKINTDPVNTPNAQPQQLLAPALVNTLSANMLRNRNFNNELMQVTVSETDAEGAVFRYDFPKSTSDNLWNNWYLQLTNFKDVYKLANDPVNFNKSYQGISLVCQAWIYSLITDTYGDAPFSQSNLARDSSIYEPKFDSQKDIYAGIFQMLENANTLLTANTAIAAASDPVFSGNISKWRKLGNSLYLRMLLKVAGKSETSAAAIAKIQQIVNTSPSTYPIMASNDDSAVLRWVGGAYVSPYQGVREQDWRSPAICSFFMDHMVNWADPRINISNYATNGFNVWSIAQGHNGFAGVASGYAPGNGDAKQSYFYSNTSAVSLQTSPLTGLIMNYPELQFILSECAVKGYITGSAQTYWETGVLNGILYWLPTWPNAPAAGMPSPATTTSTAAFRTYLTAADISWDETESTDAKMERIQLQKYYVLFLEDLQQWFEYRRTGHPILPKGTGLRNGGVMPARMVYPVYVQSANPSNYKAAVAAQGADEISTQVWWQKP